MCSIPQHAPSECACTTCPLQPAEVLQGSFLFNSLEDKDYAVVLDAVKEVVVEPGTRIIKQGDNGDFMPARKD